MKLYESIQQGTSAWLDLRKGLPTASCFDAIMTAGGKDGKPKKSDSQEGYLHHLLAERVLGRPIDGFKSQWMAHGNEFEDRAIAAYEWEHGVTTRKIGFVTTDDGLLGCSPDRFIDEHPEGMVEAKAPSQSVHVSYLLAATGASKKYKVQLQSELWICEKEWVDIVSYCPGFPDAVFRTVRDEEFIKELAAHVRAFSFMLESHASDFKERGWIKDKAADESPDSTFITREDADFILKEQYPEMYAEAQRVQ